MLLKNKRVNKMKKTIKNRLKSFWRNFKKVLKRPEMAILPGQLAFFFVLAIVPTITLITFGAGLLNLSTDVIYNFLANAFSNDIAQMLLNVTDISYGGVHVFFLVIVGYYIASNGPASIIITSNTIYGEEQNSFLERRVNKIF